MIATISNATYYFVASRSIYNKNIVYCCTWSQGSGPKTVHLKFMRLLPKRSWPLLLPSWCQNSVIKMTLGREAPTFPPSKWVPFWSPVSPATSGTTLQPPRPSPEPYVLVLATTATSSSVLSNLSQLPSGLISSQYLW